MVDEIGMAAGPKSKTRKVSTRPTAKAAKPAAAAKPAKAAAAGKPAARPPRSAPPAEVELDADALEFIEAIQRYRQEQARPFPSWSEVLHVLRSLGYRKAN